MNGYNSLGINANLVRDLDESILQKHRLHAATRNAKRMERNLTFLLITGHIAPIAHLMQMTHAKTETRYSSQTAK
jgi:hypothetical protein